MDAEVEGQGTETVVMGNEHVRVKNLEEQEEQSLN